MDDTGLKENLENLRHSIIRTQFNLDGENLLSLAFNRNKLKYYSTELISISQSLSEIEDAFDENIQIPKDINGSIIRAAQLSILFSIRRTTSDALANAKSTLMQIHADINYYRSLTIALIALIASVIGLVINAI